MQQTLSTAFSSFLRRRAEAPSASAPAQHLLTPTTSEGFSSANQAHVVVAGRGTLAARPAQAAGAVTPWASWRRMQEQRTATRLTDEFRSELVDRGLRACCCSHLLRLLVPEAGRLQVRQLRLLAGLLQFVAILRDRHVPPDQAAAIVTLAYSPRTWWQPDVTRLYARAKALLLAPRDLANLCAAAALHRGDSPLTLEDFRHLAQITPPIGAAARQEAAIPAMPGSAPNRTVTFPTRRVDAFVPLGLTPEAHWRQSPLRTAGPPTCEAPTSAAHAAEAPPPPDKPAKPALR